MEWVITQDLIATDSSTNRAGYAYLLKSVREKLNAENETLSARTAAKLAYAETLPFRFRLLDDDGNVYYVGKCGDLDNASCEAAFGPLDWAMNDSGCTEMQYRKNTNEEWKTL